MTTGSKLEALSRIRRPSIGEIFQETQGLIDLATNEAAFGQYRHYPSPFPLHQMVAREFQVAVESLTLTRGAEEAIALVYAAYAEPGDRTVKISPTFGMVEVYERMYRTQTVELSYERDLSVPLDELRAVLGQRPRICYLANPNNITGSMLSHQQLVSLLEHCRDLETYLILDVAYLSYASGYDHVRDLLNFARYPRLVVAVSFSKDYGLAGIRSGCAIAAPAVIEMLRKTQPMHEISSAAVEATVEAIQDGSVRRANLANAHRWKEVFRRELPEIYVPSEANFILLRTSAAAKLHQKLLAEGIRTRREFGHPVMEGMVRITIGPPPIMERVLKAAREVLC